VIRCRRFDIGLGVQTVEILGVACADEEGALRKRGDDPARAGQLALHAVHAEVPQGLLGDLHDVGAWRQSAAPRVHACRGARQAPWQLFEPARILEIDEAERGLDQAATVPGHLHRLEGVAEGRQTRDPLLRARQGRPLPEVVRARCSEAFIETHPLLLLPRPACGRAGIASGEIRLDSEDECGRQDEGGVGCERQGSRANEPAHQTLQEKTRPPSSQAGREGLRSGVIARSLRPAPFRVDIRSSCCPVNEFLQGALDSSRPLAEPQCVFMPVVARHP